MSEPKSEPSGYEKAVKQSQEMAAQRSRADKHIRAQEALQALRAEWRETLVPAPVASLCERRAERDKAKEQAA